MTALDWGIVGGLIVLISGCYAYTRTVDHRGADKRKALEDCVESKLEKVQKSLDGFEKEVIDRLARIETKIGNGGAKRGAGEGHSE